MTAGTRFLYGDSTLTPFETNLLLALRDTIDFTAEVAEADQTIATAPERKSAARAKAMEESGQVQRLIEAVLGVVSAPDKGALGAPAVALAEELARAAAERRKAHLDVIADNLGATERAVDAATAAARERYRAALETHLLLRAPYGAVERLTLTLTSPGKGEYVYETKIEGRWSVGVDYTLDVTIPPESTFATVVTVEELAPGLAITAPQMSGLIKKEIKAKRQKLGKHVVTRLAVEGRKVRASLRSDFGETTGFDWEVDVAAGSVAISRAGDPADPAIGAFDIPQVEGLTIVDLARTLDEAARKLPRKQLAQALFDGVLFDGRDALVQPKLVEVVGRLVELVAPFVHDIAAHSREEGELVLRRSLADGHREEIYLQKATLVARLAALDAPHRALFEPLALDTPPAPAEPFPAREPASVVRSALPPRESPPDPPKLVLMPSEPPSATTSEDASAAPTGRSPALVAALKEVYAASKEKGLDEGYRRYAELLVSDPFLEASTEDKRQVLKMMIHAKLPARVSEPIREAHTVAIEVLHAMTDADQEPADYEMLGMAYLIKDEPGKALAVFKKALDIERARDPASSLCGNLMRRVSQI